MPGLFDVLLADPPWHYNHRKACGNNTRFGGGAMKHYQVEKEAVLANMPVQSVMAKNALCFMWATWPHLETALRLLKAWGFTYVTCGFDWFKITPNDKLCFGVGYYAKANSEFVLLGKRGKPLKPATQAVSNVIEDWDWEDFPTEQFKAVRSPEHSRKPAQVLQRITQMYPTQRKLEMFARRPYPGWVNWGNELTSLPLERVVDLDPEPPTVVAASQQLSLLEQLNGKN